MSLIPKGFRQFLFDFKDNWRSIDVRIIAIRSEIGWIFQSINIILDHDLKNKPLFENLPCIDELLVIHDRWDIDQLNNLLEQIEKGELIVGQETIHIKFLEGENWNLLSSLNHRFYEKDESIQRFNIEYPSMVLQGYYNRRWDYNEKITRDHKLRSGMIPWDGMEDLRSNFLGFGSNWASRDDSFLNIVAPIYIKLKKTELKNFDLKIILEKPDTICYEDISISLISYHENNNITRLKHTVLDMSTTIKLKQKPLLIKILVNYRNYAIDYVELLGRTLNSRINVYQQIVGNIQEFNQDLTTNSRYFEAKTSLLFHLLGLSPAYYGYSTQNTPDILVFSKENNFVLVVECTTREPDLNNKLTKLSTRTREIDNVLDMTVLPILVTVLERSMINLTDLEKAQKEEIALLTRDNIPILISMSMEGKTPDQVYDYLYSLIPLNTSIYSQPYM